MTNVKDHRTTDSNQMQRLDFSPSPPASSQRLAEDMINRSKAEFDFWPFQPLKRHKLEWAPHVETFDLKDLTLIRLRLPGLELTEFEVSVEGDCLVMRGSRKPQAAGDDEYFHCTDCAAGEFYGSFRLPEGTIVEGIKASYRNGVLEVRIPRPVSRDPRKLVIEVE